MRLSFFVPFYYTLMAISSVLSGIAASVYFYNASYFWVNLSWVIVILLVTSAFIFVKLNRVIRRHLLPFNPLAKVSWPTIFIRSLILFGWICVGLEYGINLLVFHTYIHNLGWFEFMAQTALAPTLGLLLLDFIFTRFTLRRITFIETHPRPLPSSAPNGGLSHG